MRNNGKNLEHLIEKIQTMINHDTDAWIKRNVKIKDTIGINREVDVVVESQSQGVSLFSVFECKDFSTSKNSTKVDIKIVDSFIGKCLDLPQIDNKVIVSSTGFTNNAKKKADKHNIILQSLTPIPSADTIVDTKIVMHYGKTSLLGKIKYLLRDNYVYEYDEALMVYSNLNDIQVDIIELIKGVLKTNEYQECKLTMFKLNNHKSYLTTLFICTSGKLYAMNTASNKYPLDMILIPIKVEYESCDGTIEAIAQMKQDEKDVTTTTFDRNNTKVTHIKVEDKQDVLIEQDGRIKEPILRYGI